jgi:hypothetical protein
MAGLSVGLCEQFQRWRPLNNGPAKRAQVTSCSIHSSGYITALERQCRTTQDGDRMVLRLLNQIQCLITASLSPTQFGQACERVCPLARCACEDRRCAAQLNFRLLPLAAEHEHASVVRPADRPQRANVLIDGYRGKPLAPLCRAIEITHSLAGEDQIAARETDRNGVAHLASGHRRGRFVQASHSGCDLTLAHERQASQRPRRHLKV